MRDLERLLREKLTALADETVTAVPLAERARAGRRRRTRRLVGAAAAAVVLVTGGTGVALHRSGAESAPSGGTPSGNASDTAPDVPGGYRLEVWHDVSVYVPASWGWGGAPGACGVGPTVGPDGHRLTASERGDGVLSGYVGRPVGQTSHCAKRDTARVRGDEPFVWLGADVAVGTSHLGDFVIETRWVGGTTVTVGSDDADLRAGILSSAHRTELGECAGSLPSPPSPSSHGSGRFVPVSMAVCAYAPAASASGYQLAYQEDLAMGPAKQLADAVAKAKPMGEYSCYGASGGEWALLRLAGDGGQRRDYVVDLSCPSIADPTGLQHRLTSADVLPWAVDGVNAVLHANPLIDVPGRLIGP